MSLKCSIFGHRFGDPVVDREREEAGSEVVITIRETQTCDRCGQQRVVSENKEVTTLESADETPDESADRAGTGPSSAAGVGASPGTDAPATGSTTGAASEVATDDAAAAEGPATADADVDDATIIEESPAESLVEEAEPEPEDAGEARRSPASPDAGGNADVPDDDAVILEDEPHEEAGRAPGEWPEEPADEDPEWTPPTDVGTTGDDSDPDPSPTVEPAGEAVTVPEGTFHCHECGFSTAVESSSLREGDFCPDCHTGTLVHEPDDA